MDLEGELTALSCVHLGDLAKFLKLAEMETDLIPAVCKLEVGIEIGRSTHT